MNIKGNTRVRDLLLLTAIVGLTTTGCWFHGPNNVRDDLSDAAGVELDQEIGITLGRFGTYIAKKAVKWSGEEDVPELKGLKKVQVGVYDVVGLRHGYENRRPLSMDLFSDEWTPLVRVHERGEDVFVLTRQDNQDIIRAMLVVVAEEDEWVIVRMKGNLSRIIESAMQLAFDEADRPELYDATRRERGLDTQPASEDFDDDDMYDDDLVDGDEG